MTKVTALGITVY